MMVQDQQESISQNASLGYDFNDRVKNFNKTAHESNLSIDRISEEGLDTRDDKAIESTIEVQPDLYQVKRTSIKPSKAPISSPQFKKTRNIEISQKSTHEERQLNAFQMSDDGKSKGQTSKYESRYHAETKKLNYYQNEEEASSLYEMWRGNPHISVTSQKKV